MDESTINKFQHQFWVTKQTVFRRLGKKEDEHIVASDSTLDAKLELFKSIRQTSSAMNKLLDRYQERICYLAQEQNTMGRFLKEHGKVDKSGAGKMMIQMGKSLIYCSQQEIALRPSLLRLYQEVETFRNRAIEDTLDTVKRMERVRTEYRATLNWMKNVSQELDPDTYKQMEKFRKVQTHVKMSKAQFDKLKLACLQKVDLLAAARCNMFSHALIQYQISSSRTTENIARVFNMLATSFKGYQHYEFSVIKDLAEPSKQLALRDAGDGDGIGCKSDQQKDADTDDLLLDIGESSEGEKKTNSNTKQDKADEDLLALGDLANGPPGAVGQMVAQKIQNLSLTNEELLSSKNASDLLENLLGPLDLSPDTEAAQEALDLTLAWPSSSNSGSADGDKSKESGSGAGAQSSSTSSLIGSFRAPSNLSKDKEDRDLLSGGDFDSLNFEGDTNDTMALLQELLTAGSTNSMLTPQVGGLTSAFSELAGLTPTSASSSGQGQGPSSNSKATATATPFLPSQLLNLESLDSSNDLLNFNAPSLQPMSSSSSKPAQAQKKADASANANKSWYDIFADLDPLENPDAVGKKESDEIPSRYC